MYFIISNILINYKKDLANVVNYTGQTDSNQLIFVNYSLTELAHFENRTTLLALYVFDSVKTDSLEVNLITVKLVRTQ